MPDDVYSWCPGENHTVWFSVYYKIWTYVKKNFHILWYIRKRSLFPEGWLRHGESGDTPDENCNKRNGHSKSPALLY